MTAVLALTHEPVDLVFATVVLAVLTVAVWRRTRCGCPGPCPVCPPLADDHQADAEYRATRHLFESTTGPGRNPGRR